MPDIVRILLLEDQAADAELLERELRRSGKPIAMLRVDSEAAFRHQIEVFRPDLILSDYHLPGFDGMTALSIVREKSRELPFIFVSGSIGEERAVEALTAGATDYIIKDRPARINAAVERALIEKAQREQRLRMEADLRYRAEFDHLVTAFATDFIHLRSDEIDRAIAKALEQVGEFAGVDRASVVLFRDGDLMDGTHEWSRPDIPSERPNRQGIPLARFPWAMGKLRQLEEVAVASIEALPPEAERERERLTEIRVASVLAVPMVISRTVIGFVIFESLRKEQEWGENSIALLRIVSSIFASAIGRKRQEESLESALRANELILESAAEGIFGVDLEGRITFINSAAAGLLGYRSEELVGRSKHEMTHHKRIDGTEYPWEECPLYLTMRDGLQRAKLKEVVWHKDGRAIRTEFSSAPIRDRGVIVGGVATMKDITQELLLEEQLEREKRLSSLGRLAATIAHEINNVLMGVQPFAEVIEKINSSDERIAKAVRHIRGSVQRGKGITEQILRYTRPAPPVKKTIDVAKWLNDFVVEMRGMMRSEIEIHVVNPDDAIQLLVDPTQLNQVFSNLVLNARDAIGERGDITLRARTHPPNTTFPFGIVPNPERFAHFIVSDNGSGIPAESISQIFEPLFTTKQRGTGLGLSVVHQVVTAHGGFLFVESAVGVGTTFHVFLPLAVSNGENHAS